MLKIHKWRSYECTLREILLEKNPSSEPGFKPVTGISISLINHIASIGSQYSGGGDLAEVMETTTVATYNIT